MSLREREGGGGRVRGKEGRKLSVYKSCALNVT